MYSYLFFRQRVRRGGRGLIVEKAMTDAGANALALASDTPKQTNHRLPRGIYRRYQAIHYYSVRKEIRGRIGEQQYSTWYGVT